MEKVTKTHIVLGFIIFDLVIAVIVVLSWRAKDSQQIINEVSLLSGLSSITLAIVAIGYAFLQSYQSSKESIIVLKTLEKIDEKVKEISDIKNHVKEISDIKDQVNEINFNLKLNATINQNLSENYTIVPEKSKSNQ